MEDEPRRVAELRAAGDVMHDARRASDKARDIARDLALAAIADGMGEAPVARHIGVDRMTLRRWQGKPR